MRLGLGFLDTDEEVEKKAGRTISEIFALEGEAGFRMLERREVFGACERDGFVVALGGGAAADPELATAARESGVVVLLEASAETLYGRISADETSKDRRPGLTSSGGLEEVKVLLERRREAYETAAHFRVDTEGVTPVEVAERISAAIGPFENLEENSDNNS